MERLMKNAYLYATFSEEDPQLGAILVQDDVIIGAGWNTHVSRTAVSEIEMAIATCQHSSEGCMIVSPMPPDPRRAALIVIAGITHLVYHRRMRALLKDDRDVEMGLSMLEENDIKITEFDGYLNCFKLRYEKEIFVP